MISTNINTARIKKKIRDSIICTVIQKKNRTQNNMINSMVEHVHSVDTLIYLLFVS